MARNNTTIINKTDGEQVNIYLFSLYTHFRCQRLPDGDIFGFNTFLSSSFI